MRKALLLLSSLCLLVGPVNYVLAEDTDNSETTEAVKKDDSKEIEDEFDPESYDTVYETDVYKVGTDMPEGIYKAFAVEDYASVEINNDARGEDYVAYISVETFAYFEVTEGQFVDLKDCFAIPADEAVPAKIEDGIAGPGHYRIGFDIEPGEYKVKALGEYAHYEINGDANGEDYIDYGYFEKSNYVEVREGEFLILSEAEMIVDQITRFTRTESINQKRTSVTLVLFLSLLD